MSPDRTRAPSLAAGLLVLLAGGLQLRPLSSTQLWGHLAAGRALRSDGGASPHPGEGLHQQASPVLHEGWLFDAAALRLWELSGVAGALLSSAVLASAVAFLAWLLARAVLGEQRPWAALGLTCLVVGGAGATFEPAPGSAALVALAAVSACILHARGARGLRRGLWLAGLGLGVGLWSQLDGSCSLAPLVVFGCALPRSGVETPWRPAELAALAGICLLPLAHPLGPSVFTQLGTLGGAGGLDSLGTWPTPGGPLLYAVLLLGLGLYPLARRESPPLGFAGLTLAALLLAPLGSLHPGASVLLLLPLAADAVCRTSARTEQSVLPWVCGAAVLGVPLAVGGGLHSPSLRWDVHSVPVDAAGALEELGLDSSVLVAPGASGPWLRWALPELEVLPALGSTAEDQPPEASTLIAERSSVLCSTLSESEAWDAAWFGERSAIFVRAGRSDARPLRALSPCTATSNVGRCIEAPSPDPFFAELDRTRVLDPAHGYLDRLGTALALHCSRSPQRAASLLDRARRFDPHHPDLARFEGRLHFGQGQLELALAALDRAPASDGAATDVRLQVLQLLGRSEDALPGAYRRVEELGDRAPGELLALLAWACAEQGELGCAVSQATRGALQGNRESLQLLQELQLRGQLPDTHRGLLGAAQAGQPLP